MGQQHIDLIMHNWKKEFLYKLLFKINLKFIEFSKI